MQRLVTSKVVKVQAEVHKIHLLSTCSSQSHISRVKKECESNLTKMLFVMSLTLCELLVVEKSHHLSLSDVKKWCSVGAILEFEKDN